MLMGIVVLLVILWALGFFAVNIGGGFIHFLLVLAIVIFIYNLLTGRRQV